MNFTDFASVPSGRLVPVPDQPRPADDSVFADRMVMRSARSATPADSSMIDVPRLGVITLREIEPGRQVCIRIRRSCDAAAGAARAS
jgi:hypothetical protein